MTKEVQEMLQYYDAIVALDKTISELILLQNETTNDAYNQGIYHKIVTLKQARAIIENLNNL